MTYTYRNDLHRHLHEVLCDAAENRQDGWVEHERAAMCGAVNEARSRLGKAPLTLDDVASVEQAALGHVDYGTKFALYCTELVEDRE